MQNPRLFIQTALLFALVPVLTAAPPAAQWRATGEPVAAGIGRILECAGRGCPVNPPESGPACWWYSYENTIMGSVGRLACLSPGDHYLDGMQGLKLTVAAVAEPQALIEPAPLPDLDAAPIPVEPAATADGMGKLLLGIAGLALLASLWLRPRWPAWRLRRAAADYARAPSPATLEILAGCVRDIHPQSVQDLPTPLAEHVRQLDAARFGGRPLAPQAVAFFAGEATTRSAAETR